MINGGFIIFLKNMNRINVLYISFISIVVSSILYNVWFFHVLHLSISLRTIISILLLSAIFALSIYILQHKNFFWFASLASIALTLYTIANFIYIDIFNTFFSFAFFNVAQSQTIFASIRYFYTAIPLSIYFSSVIYTIFLIIFFRYIYTRRKKTYLTISTCIASIVLFACVALAVYSTQYYVKHPRDNWLQHNYYISDIGIFGNIFVALHDNIFHIQDISYAQTYDTDYINSIKQNLSYLHDATKKIDTSLPDLPIDRPHIVHYQLESIPLWGIEHDPTAMPFLKDLMKKSITVKEFYSNGCHTIDAEFATLCSFLPDKNRPISDIGKNNNYYCLPQILHDKYDYLTSVMHSNESFFWSRDVLDPAWGFFDMKFVPDDFLAWKMDDSIALSKVVDFLAHSPKPAFVELISASSHSAHSVEDLKFVGKISHIDMEFYTADIEQKILDRIELDETDTQIYLSYLKNIDNALKGFFENLEKQGLADKTIVVIDNDHKYYKFDESDKIGFNLHHRQPFLIYIPHNDGQQIETLASHIDIAPSILHLLDKTTSTTPPNFVGTSIFNPDHSSSVINSCYDTIYYKNNNEIITGNSALRIYNAVYDTTISDDKLKEKSLYIQDTIQKSHDAILNNQL